MSYSQNTIHCIWLQTMKHGPTIWGKWFDNDNIYIQRVILKCYSTLWRFRCHVIVADREVASFFNWPIYYMHFALCSEHHISRCSCSRIIIFIPIERFAIRLNAPGYSFSKTCTVLSWEAILCSLVLHMRCRQQVEKLNYFGLHKWHHYAPPIDIF